MNRRRTKVTKITALAFIGLLFLLVWTAGQQFDAYAQESCEDCTKEQIIESLYNGPVYLDSYWTTSDSSSADSENPTQRVEVEVGPGDGASTLAVVLVNRGPADISGVIGHLSLPEGFKATGRGTGSPADAALNQIATVGTPFTLFFDVDVLDNASVKEYSTNLKVDYSRYFETGVPRSKEIAVPFRITGEPVLTVGRGASDGGIVDSQIAAGRIEEFAFDVANEGTAPITNVVITMVSPSESLEILGDSKWTIQRIVEDSKVSLSTQVFAARPLIGNPASFDVTIEYSSNGISSSETFKMGTYVAGEISINAYEIEVTDIGGIPNVVGNLLNEGNTVALFTTIELVNAGNLVTSLPPQQYLGDLEENSPLPFSIPVDVGTAEAGTYPISLKVTYKDNLREVHTLDINSEVRFVPEQRTDESAAAPGMEMAIPIIVGIAIAVAIVVVVLIRRRKRSALRRTITHRKQDDIESLLDSHQRIEKRPEDRK